MLAFVGKSLWPVFSVGKLTSGDRFPPHRRRPLEGRAAGNAAHGRAERRSRPPTRLYFTSAATAGGPVRHVSGAGAGNRLRISHANGNGTGEGVVGHQPAQRSGEPPHRWSGPIGRNQNCPPLRVTSSRPTIEVSCVVGRLEPRPSHLPPCSSNSADPSERNLTGKTAGVWAATGFSGAVQQR